MEEAEQDCGAPSAAASEAGGGGEQPDDFCRVSAKKSDAAQERTSALGPTAQPRRWNSTSGRRVRDDFVNSGGWGWAGGGVRAYR